MLEVFDRNLKRVAYLENAFDIYEDLKINSINYLNFTIPFDDRKTEFLKPFWYVKGRRGLYRILPQILESDETDILKVECEHVIATLIDEIMFGNVIYGNLGIYTNQVINFVLNKQKVKHWKLGVCEFSRQFEYLWEYENLASALFSIPKPISESYIWEFDTEKYPWTLNLRRLKVDDPPVAMIMAGKNQLKLTRSSDPKQLFTRIYPLGYGEGVNQLGIKDVNNNIPYLQAGKEYTDKYGIIERVWIDRRYENPQSLKDAAQTMLDEFKDILYEYDVNYAQLDTREVIEIGDKIRIITPDGARDDFVVGIKADYQNLDHTVLTLANKSRSIATTIADMADRQRIEMSYSQGATQIYAQSLQANADTRDGAKLNFFIPSEMRIINKVLAKIKIESFRAYSQATEGGGATSTTTDSGGRTYTSSEFGGANYPTTSSDGGQFQTTGQYTIGGQSTQAENDSYHWGTHDHGIPRGTYFLTAGGGSPYGWVPSGAHSHGTHSHDYSFPGHTHEVNMSRHNHSINIDAHSHRFTIVAHTHQIKAGIYKFGNPQSFTLKVNNRTIRTYYSTGEEVDLTSALLNAQNKISRGSWQSIEIVPNDIAYISIDMMLQGFVQSRGDYTV